MQTTALLSVAVFFASVVRGYTGFALSAIVITTMAYWIPARELVPVLIPLEIIASLLFVRNVSGSINWQTIIYVAAGAAVSIPVASLVLLRLPTEITHAIIAGLVMLATSVLLSRRGLIFSAGKITWSATGIVMGFFSGIGSLGGMAGMVMLLSTSSDAAKTRATMIALLLLTSIYGAIFSYTNGMMTVATMQRTLIVCIPMTAGLFIGHLCFKHYGRSLRTATLILLATLSGIMLLQSVWHLLQ